MAYEHHKNPPDSCPCPLCKMGDVSVPTSSDSPTGRLLYKIKDWNSYAAFTGAFTGAFDRIEGKGDRTWFQELMHQKHKKTKRKNTDKVNKAKKKRERNARKKQRKKK